MCRSIKQLRGLESLTEDDIRAAARQYVRKVSGYRQPSRVNETAFNHAVDEIAAATQHLLDALITRKAKPTG